MVEKIAFNTTHFAALLASRLTGSSENAFVMMKQAHGHPEVVPAIDRLAQLDPVKFLTSPGLWIGLVIFAAFLFMAVRFRRDRGPL